MQLGAHVQAVRCLGLGARIEQLAHPVRVAVAVAVAREDPEVYRFGGYVPQHARRDRERRTAGGLAPPVDQHALWRGGGVPPPPPRLSPPPHQPLPPPPPLAPPAGPPGAPENTRCPRGRGRPPP